MPRKKPPKARFKKAEKGVLKSKRDGGKAFLVAFTGVLDAKFPEAR